MSKINDLATLDKPREKAERFGIEKLNLRRHLKPIFYLVAVNLAIDPVLEDLEDCPPVLE